MTGPERLRALLRARDELLAKRQSIDREIAGVEREMEALSGGAVASGATPVASTPVTTPVPTETPPRNSISAFVLWKLRRQSQIDFGVFAREFYGEDTPRRRQLVSNSLFYLQRKKLIRRVGSRTWKLSGNAR